MRLVLDRFWDRELERLYGVRFDTPDALVRYHGYEAVTCGTRTIHSPKGAFYCPTDGDEKVAIDVDWFVANYQENPDEAVVFLVMAHEWGHAVQDSLREEGVGKATWRPPYRQELNADCLAGSWIGYQVANLFFDVDPDDPLGPVRLLLARSGSGELGTPGDHGTPEQRQEAVVVGALRGTLRCQSVY